MTEDTIVIVGAGLAGVKAAETLRAEQFDGRIVLIGAEPDAPYDRPPLSKGYLLGKQDRGSVDLHDEQWYADNEVELLLRRRVARLDRAARQVELDDGERIGYTELLLTTGSSPRRLRIPGTDLQGVHYLRRLGQSDALRADLEAGGRVVVVGAGWIGLETAAAARAHGCEVTVIEPNPTPLHPVLGPELGGFFADVHRAHGVEFRLGTGVTELRGSARVSSVVTGDGTEIAAGTVIIGVGARPNTELAEEAGLAVDDGIVVDASLRTGDPHVFAAGDVARARNPFYGDLIRVEHWANALNGGSAAARAMLGQDVAYDELPYFFSDQYDLGMEFAGWFPPGGYDRVVTRGDTEGQAFQAFWLTDGRVVAGLHVNLWDEGIEPIKALIRSRRPVDPDRLVDTSTPLTTHLGG
jgi:3-phenylpropionate/trans-cinnamate dioxygenase ferredoxin reductase subunit